jgi:SAM-dependent methyltransferase
VTGLSRPAEGPELLDDPALSWEDARDAYVDIAASNRWLLGLGPIVRECGDLVRVAARDGRSPVTLLDAGCGGGDASRALARWASRARIDLRVTAIDLSPLACRYAREACAGEPSIEVVEGDAFSPPRTADVIHAGMVLHHVPRPEQAGVLRRLVDAARVGVVVSDLRRTHVGYWGARAFGLLTGRRRLFRHDGPLSIARGFTIDEGRAIAAAAGVPEARVAKHACSRLTWTVGPLPDRASSS